MGIVDRPYVTFSVNLAGFGATLPVIFSLSLSLSLFLFLSLCLSLSPRLSLSLSLSVSFSLSVYVSVFVCLSVSLNTLFYSTFCLPSPDCDKVRPLDRLVTASASPFDGTVSGKSKSFQAKLSWSLSIFTFLLYSLELICDCV